MLLDSYDMDRDFKAYNEVYAEHFGEIKPALDKRTSVPNCDRDEGNRGCNTPII